MKPKTFCCKFYWYSLPPTPPPPIVCEGIENRFNSTGLPCSTQSENHYLILKRSVYFYRPLTKLREGNVFTPVCDSVHRGGSLSGGMSVPGVLCPEGSRSVGGGSLSVGESLSMGGFCPGELYPGSLCQGDPPPPCTVKNRRYASYWNAFL